VDISAKNGKSHSKFKCIDCGYEINTDLNACFNILERRLEKNKTLGNRVTGQEDYRRSKNLVCELSKKTFSILIT